MQVMQTAQRQDTYLATSSHHFLVTHFLYSSNLFSSARLSRCSDSLGQGRVEDLEGMVGRRVMCSMESLAGRAVWATSTGRGSSPGLAIPAHFTLCLKTPCFLAPDPARRPASAHD